VNIDPPDINGRTFSLSVQAPAGCKILLNNIYILYLACCFVLKDLGLSIKERAVEKWPPYLNSLGYLHANSKTKKVEIWMITYYYAPLKKEGGHILFC